MKVLFMVFRRLSTCHLTHHGMSPGKVALYKQSLVWASEGVNYLSGRRGCSKSPCDEWEDAADWIHDRALSTIEKLSLCRDL
jgi:hypothetical protein